MDVGYLSVQGLSSDDYPDSLSRGVLADDAVYFINGTKVFSALWNDPFNQTGHINLPAESANIGGLNLRMGSSPI